MDEFTFDCDHSELEYIGEQELFNGDSYSLCNCLKCRTTISLGKTNLRMISIIKSQSITRN